MLGLHTTVAPRRPNTQPAPILERYAFVPFTEASAIPSDKKTELSSYLKKCELAAKRIISSGMQKVGELEKCEGLFGDDVIEGVEEIKGEKCLLLKLLHEIEQLDSAEDAKDLIKANKDLQNDCLFSALVNSSNFKSCVDVVRENLPKPGIKVVEVAAEKGRLFKQIVPQLLAEPQLQLEYSAAASTGEKIDASLLKELGVTEASWDWSSTPAKSLTGNDLVIANNVLHSQPSLSDAIKQLASLTNSHNGYFLIKEMTSHFAVPAVLDSLTSSAEITDNASRTLGPFCNVPTWRRILKENGLQIIAEKSDGLFSTMFLCKAIEEVSEATIISCDSLAYKWVEELKVAITSSEVQKVWLVASTLNTGIVGMVNCLRQEPGGEKIR